MTIPEDNNNNNALKKPFTGKSKYSPVSEMLKNIGM